MFAFQVMTIRVDPRIPACPRPGEHDVPKTRGVAHMEVAPAIWWRLVEGGLLACWLLLHSLAILFDGYLSHGHLSTRSCNSQVHPLFPNHSMNNMFLTSWNGLACLSPTHNDELALPLTKLGMCLPRQLLPTTLLQVACLSKTQSQSWNIKMEWYITNL